MADHSREFPFPRPWRDPDYEDQLIKWAHTYDGYKRLASGEFEPWGVLGVVLAPLVDSFWAGGAIPKWAGVDLLRGWAFLLVRRNRHEDGWLLDEHPELYAIVRAITHHPASTESDLPPKPDEDFDWIFE